MFNETTGSGHIGTWMIDFADMKNKSFWCNNITAFMAGLKAGEKNIFSVNNNIYPLKDVFRNISGTIRQ